MDLAGWFCSIRIKAMLNCNTTCSSHTRRWGVKVFELCSNAADSRWKCDAFSDQRNLEQFSNGICPRCWDDCEPEFYSVIKTHN